MAFFLIIFLAVLCLYARGRPQTVPNAHLATSLSSSSAAVPLDPDVLKCLPSAVFRSATDAKAGNAFECAICLSELADGSLARILPQCRHTFHLECIHTWFLSNSTCPICRSAVERPPASEPSTITKEDVKAPALERLRSRGEDSSFSSGGWDVEIGINGFANWQRIAAAGEVSERG